ncbi:MAG: glycogen synthase [Acidimicrobiaceae bacterium]
MTRFAVVSNLYPPHAYGGYELLCADTVRRWRAAGHDIAVITSTHVRPDVGSDSAERVSDVARVLPLSSVFVPPPAKARRLLVERTAHARLHAELERADPDVISVWNWAGLPGSLLEGIAGFGRPVVFVMGDAWLPRVRINDPWLAAWQRAPSTVRNIASRVTGVPTSLRPLGPVGRWSFASDALRTSMLDADTRDGPFRDTHVCHFGIDAHDFPSSPRPSRPWEWRLLYVGRLDPSKGVDTLLEALTRLPDRARLDVVGPPEVAHLDRLHALAARLGLADRVTFDAVPRSDLAARYRAADACVFPSEWDEPFGLVPLEAMACNTPVIATGTGGSAEYLVDEANCLLFPPGDPQALAAALTRLADDRALRDRMVSAGLVTANEFTADRFAAQLGELHLGHSKRNR